MTLDDQLWAAVEPTTYVPRAQYFAALDGWTIKPYIVDGAIVGATVTRGPEFHFIVFHGGWRLTRAVVREHLDPILREHGHVTTRTPVDDKRMQHFNELIGFEKTGADEYNVHYTLKQLFQRKTPCQSPQ